MLFQNTPAWVQQTFNGQTFDPNKLDIQDDGLYDTVTLATGATVNQNATSFFTNVKASSGKTLADTNLQRDSELADPEMFAIRAISLHFDSNIALADLQAIFKLFAFQLTVGKKPLLTVPLYRFPAGGGIAGITTATSTTVLQNGEPTFQSFRALAVPIVIPPGVNFFANFVGGSHVLTGAAGMRCQCLFSGLYAKGVQ